MTTARSRLRSTTCAVAAAVGVAVAVGGGTYAGWNDREALAGGVVVTAGTAGLSVTAPTGLDAGRLYPGRSVSAGFSVHNTGTVPLDLRVAALSWPSAGAPADRTALAGASTVHLWPDTGEGCGPVPATPAWTGTFAAPAGDLGVSVAGGAGQAMCLAVALAADAPDVAQGATVDVSLTLGGVQP
ncbi:TasA family protein [Kocuria rhizosphaerae]|uniref:TasA family protein n=1 Tax=Kocuria rhizosphaerae TaxID=3376285 RepID=UPI0037C056B8